tara:strand:- start:525 stop:893 length:369 start_codon:yes stop_codon:yes gene_type:complete
MIGYGTMQILWRYKTMGVKVYLESPTGSWADEIAYFQYEEDYNVCFEALEKKAEADNHIITESIEDGEDRVTIVFSEADPEDESEKTYSFNTENELKAFLTGVNETKGKTIKEISLNIEEFL